MTAPPRERVSHVDGQENRGLAARRRAALPVVGNRRNGQNRAARDKRSVPHCCDEKRQCCAGHRERTGMQQLLPQRTVICISVPGCAVMRAGVVRWDPRPQRRQRRVGMFEPRQMHVGLNREALHEERHEPQEPHGPRPCPCAGTASDGSGSVLQGCEKHLRSISAVVLGLV